MTTAMTGMTKSTPTATRGRADYSRLSRWWWSVRVFVRFVAGYVRYLWTGSNTPEAYADMRRLFRMTGGRFNDAFSAIMGVAYPPYAIRAGEGVAGVVQSPGIDNAITALKRDGVHVFGRVLDADDCAAMIRWAESTPCRPIPKPDDSPSYVQYDRERPVAPKYAFDEKDILAQPVAQRLAADASMLALAQRYLGARPVLSSCVAWWSTSLLDRPSSDAAQLFHFDMNHVRFVKFFFYLTDVGEDNGPHAYLRRSHRRLHRSLREDRRFIDAEVFACYDEGDLLRITGAAGTMFAADTRGLHKGTRLLRGDRLVLEFQFATSHFGDSPGSVRIENAIPELRGAALRFPRTFNRFDLR